MKQTSRVLATWNALYELLDGQTWPPHPTTGERPLVIFGDAIPTENEMVYVIGVPPTPPSADWATFGTTQSQAERFTLQVLVGTRVPGQDRAEVLARLGELSEVVQNAIRDPATGKQAGGFSESAGSNGQPGPLWWSMERYVPGVVADTEGFRAYADIYIQFNANI